MTTPDRATGLRPKIHASCRPSLQVHLDARVSPVLQVVPEVLQAAEHAVSCASCRRHVRAADVLAGALRQRPGVPAQLSSPAFLERVYERAVAQFEDGGSLVTELARPVTPPLGADALSGPGGLLAPSIGALVGAAPPQPSVWAWEKVRRSVRAETLRPAMRVTRRRLMLTMTLAATLAVAVFLVANRSTDRGPEIRFVELGSAPAVEFAVLRHGFDH